MNWGRCWAWDRNNSYVFRAVASALKGVGIAVSVPLGVVGTVCGLVSTVLPAVNKKVGKKVNKHSRLSALAAAKLVSQALDDNRVSDAEFKHITHEMIRGAMSK